MSTNDNIFSGPIPPRAKIISKSIIDKRRCEIPGHIPHPTPPDANYDDWESAYFQQLMVIYDIVANTVNEKYPKNRIKWADNEELISNTSQLVYDCSSKYISPYLENEMKSESKEVEEV